MYLGKNIKYLRKAQGLGQAELADRIGKTKATISSYELGTSFPPLEVFLQLSDIFQVSLDDLAKKNLEQEGRGTGGRNKRLDHSENVASLKENIQAQDPLVARFVQLLEQRVHTLEQAIAQRDPEWAKKLGIGE